MTKVFSQAYDDLKNLINEANLHACLQKKEPEPAEVQAILSKSLNKQALTLDETATLLQVRAPDLKEALLDAARSLKKTIYGNRIVLFAPFYIGNHCVNDCAYCGFRKTNTQMVRKTLDSEERKKEMLTLIRHGHKRLILVYGEHPTYSAEFIAETVREAYNTKEGNGEIRRVNINAAPLSKEGFSTVKAAGIGTYQIFQETYAPSIYKKWHPAGSLKADYFWRLDAFNRAFEAGVDDVGVGALFGLYDWRFEVLGLVSHAHFLQKHYNCGPHTISFPRLKHASGMQMNPKWAMNDEDFKHLIAVLRLAVPYTGLILTARESTELRKECIALGVSQIDGGTCIELGGYSQQSKNQCIDKEQFALSDERTLDQVMRELIEAGHLPSFCTACYRKGRTGEHFMEFAIPGFIHNFCTPNAILTCAEYLEDYASEETKTAGKQFLNQMLMRVDNKKLKTKIQSGLESIQNNGKRDIYF